MSNEIKYSNTWINWFNWEISIKNYFQNRKKYKILLLTANTNYKLILKQAKKFNVKNVIITNKKYYELARSRNNRKNLNILNNFQRLDKIFRTKMIM